MADPTRGSSSPASPGIAGAIRDAVSAVADAVAPRSIKQRRQQVDQSTDDAAIGRMRNAQSSDRDNDYQ